MTEETNLVFSSIPDGKRTRGPAHSATTPGGRGREQQRSQGGGRDQRMRASLDRPRPARPAQADRAAQIR